jgi:nuclear GTP-binding protein
LKKKYKIIRKVKEHNKKKTKEAKKLLLSGKKKVEKDPGIPNDWPFKEQELKLLEARRERAIQELEQKKADRKERVILFFFNFSVFFQNKNYFVT